MVMSDFTAPTAKWAMMLTANDAMTVAMPLVKENRMIGMNAPRAVMLGETRAARQKALINSPTSPPI
jgi:hypothetical protein